MNTLNEKRWAVLNCAVTQVLGRYTTRCEAEEAAEAFGNCSFPYLLSDAEMVN